MPVQKVPFLEEVDCIVHSLLTDTTISRHLYKMERSLSQNCNKLSVSGNNDLHQERADVAFASCMTSLRFQYYKKTDAVKS